MENINVLKDIKNCILQYEYPLANSMSDEELGEIFSPSNRCFLICWMFKLIGEFSISENENNVHILGKLLYENGFCTKEEHLPFMTASLNISEQFIILRRIFTFIKTVKKPLNDKNIKPVSFEDIENLSKSNMNLFPMLGEIKMITKECEITKPESENQIYKENSTTSNNCKISKVAEDIQLDLSNIKNVAECYQKQSNSSDDSILIDEEALKEFKKCSENIKLISQFMKDVNTIEEFTKYNKDILEIDHKSARSGDLLKDITEEFCSIIRILKL